MKAGIAAILLLVAALIAICVIRVGPAKAQVPVKTLLWTAPLDTGAGSPGRVSRYDLRFSSAQIGADTLAWWNAATVVTTVPPPSIPGAVDSVQVVFPQWATTYYAVIVSYDWVGNCSKWSNVARASVGPAPDLVKPPRIIDLLVR